MERCRALCMILGVLGSLQYALAARGDSSLVQPIPTQTPIAAEVPALTAVSDSWRWVSRVENTPALVEVDDFDDMPAAPRWSAWAGAIFLQRSRPHGQGLARDASGPLLNASDFKFGSTAGPDINAFRRGDRFDLDFRFFNVNRLDASRTITPNGNAEILFADTLQLDNGVITAQYFSTLQSVESNLRHRVSPRITMLGGFRYLTLREDIAITYDLLADSLGPIQQHVTAINRLYGAQLGLDGVLWDTGGRLRVVSATKAGVYANSADNALRATAFGILDVSLGTSRQNTSFVGDWNLSGVFQVTPVWALRGGYQLLWISSVALSSEQFGHVAHSFLPNLNVDNGGDIFLHGALVSLQANW